MWIPPPLLAVEAVRACARYGDRYEREARELLEGVSMVPLDDDVLDKAVELIPAQLRTLDALHLATALAASDQLGVFVTYDCRLAEAAADTGLSVVSSI
jgi:predicted nucleic acid-binding protein